MAEVKNEHSMNKLKLVEFEEKYRIPKNTKISKSKAVAAYVRNALRRFDCLETIQGYFPIFNSLRHYDIKRNLPNDIISGLIVGIMMIPQGLAYAALSTLPHIVGLYISFFAGITYFIFGTSRHLSWGCVAIVSLIIADVLYSYDNSEQGRQFIQRLDGAYNLTHISPKQLPGYVIIPLTNILSGGKSNQSRSHNHDRIREEINARRIEIAAGVTVVAGLISIAASQIGLSRITPVMSNSLITGFTVGIAFHIATSQIKEVLGISIKTYRGTGRLFRLWFDIIVHIPDTNIVVFLLTTISIIVIYLVKKFINERYKHRMRVPVPIELFVVIIGIVVSSSLHLHKDHDVQIVGKVPIGVPRPKFPDLSLVTDYISGAIVVIVVAHAQSLAMAKTLGLEYNYQISPKQELFSIGLSAFVCGIFSGYVPCASISRSIVQSGSGGKTQVASLVASGLVLLVIMVIGPYFYHLPTCVMSAIILVNIRGMLLKLLTIPSEWRVSRYDCCVWVFACVATIVLDTGLALMVSIGFSVFLIMLRHVVDPAIEVGQIHVAEKDTQLRSLDNYFMTKTVKSVKLIKVTNPVYFFNSENFTKQVFDLTEVNPIIVKSLQRKKQKGEDAILYKKSELNEETPILSVRAENGEIQNGIIPSVSENMKTLILDLSQVSFMDKMGVGALDFIVREYESIGIQVLVSSVPEKVLRILQTAGFWAKQKDRLFLNVQSAIDSIAALDEKSIETISNY